MQSSEITISHRDKGYLGKGRQEPARRRWKGKNPSGFVPPNYEENAEPTPQKPNIILMSRYLSATSNVVLNAKPNTPNKNKSKPAVSAKVFGLKNLAIYYSLENAARVDSSSATARALSANPLISTFFP